MSDAWDCLSCGAHAQIKPFCDNCGAARPVEGGDDNALSMMLGLVCENCDAYNDPGVSVCVSCGKPLPIGDGFVDEPAPPPATFKPAATTSAQRFGTPSEDTPSSPTVPPSWLTPPTGNPLQTAFAMKKVDLAAVATGAEGAG